MLDERIRAVLDRLAAEDAREREEGVPQEITVFMPSVTGVAQAGIGFGAFSTSTKHMRQFAAIESFGW